MELACQTVGTHTHRFFLEGQVEFPDCRWRLFEMAGDSPLSSTTSLKTIEALR